GASGRDRGILAAECHLRKEDFPRREGNQSTWERWKRQPGQAAARGQFALFDKGRALQAMVSEARSCEQGARSGRRDSAALSVFCYLLLVCWRMQATRLPLQASAESNVERQTSNFRFHKPTLIVHKRPDPASSSRRSTARQGGLFYYSNGPKICR